MTTTRTFYLGSALGDNRVDQRVRVLDHDEVTLTSKVEFLDGFRAVVPTVDLVSREDMRHMSAKNNITVTFTHAQIEVLHSALSLALNDPDWAVMLGSHRDFQTLARAADRVMDARNSTASARPISGRAGKSLDTQ